jgi:hypothetical protein
VLTTYEEFLEHYGTKGMRWGVRRKRRAGKASDDAKEVKLLKKKPVSQLSNQELKKANERLTLEQNFSRMNAGTVKSGHNRTKEILAVAGTAATVYNMVKSPAGQAAISAGKKHIGPVLREAGYLLADLIR